jgi:hypothetical protein
MPIKVTYANDSDAQRAFEIENAAYAAAADPVSPLLFPGPHDPNGVAVRAASLLEQKQADPTTIWLKAVDDETDDLIGFAEWHVYEPGKPVPKPPVKAWGPGSNPAVCEAFFGAIADGRERVMGGKACVCEFAVFPLVDLTGAVLCLDGAQRLISLFSPQISAYGP